MGFIMILGLLVGAIAAIIAVFILNRNMLFRLIGIIMAIACIAFGNSDAIREIYGAYNYGEAPPLYLFFETFLEIFIVVFPFMRIIAMFGNIGEYIEQNGTDKQKDALSIIVVIIKNIARIFFR